MRVADAIDRAENIYKFSTSYNRMIEWLCELEERIAIELFRSEEKKTLNIDSVLTAPDAYAELYPLYAAMKATLVEGRNDRYNELAVLFDRAYSEYIDHVNRTRAPRRTVYYKIL